MISLETEINVHVIRCTEHIEIFRIGNYIQSYSLKPLKGCKFSN